MNLTVVGGYYDECCAEPHWYERYGSGGRAAAAITGRKASIDLVTYCPTDWNASLQHFANCFGFTAKPVPSSSGVTFEYLHWLRCSGAYPHRSVFKDLPTIEVDNHEMVLCFGLYEAQAKVRAKRVVYDPQNGKESEPFSKNGSRADELAIVCNLEEGSTLTGERDPENITSSLLNVAQAVILKNGWSGLIAATKNSQETILPIPTRRVHKIGSGDIFSAEFSYYWMVLGFDPIEAAKEANKKVAYYSENGGVLPLPLNVTIAPAPTPPLPSAEKLYDVYLAGPFFSANQLAMIEEITELLSQTGARVFSPYRDVGVGKTADVAKRDLAGLRASRFIFACLDGCDPGTVFEVGYARARDIPVIAYSPNLGTLHETMFVGSDCEIITDLTTAIYRAVWWTRNK